MIDTLEYVSLRALTGGIQEGRDRCGLLAGGIDPYER